MDTVKRLVLTVYRAGSMCNNKIDAKRMVKICAMAYFCLPSMHAYSLDFGTLVKTKVETKCKVAGCGKVGETCFKGFCRAHQEFEGPCYVCSAYLERNRILSDKGKPICRDCAEKVRANTAKNFDKEMRKVDREIASHTISSPLGEFWIGATNVIAGPLHKEFAKPLMGILQR